MLTVRMNQSAQRILENVFRRLERLFALAHQLEARLSAAQWQLAALTPSLPPPHRSGATSLTRAFAGKLVSQNPTDEPAAALVERSQTYHASQSPRHESK